MNKDKMGVALGYSMLTVGAILAALASLFLRGWALIWLWAWFVVPLGMSAISFWHAMGISLVAAFLTYELNTNSEDARQEALVNTFKSIGMSLMALLVGFIYQLFM